MPEGLPRIILKYDFGNPIDLLDLAASLTAIGEQFRRFTADDPEVSKTANPSLHVAKMREGSIIAELVAVAEQVDWVLKKREIIAGFAAQWQEILYNILHFTDSAKHLDKPVVRAAIEFVEPVAKDSATQIIIAANDGGTVNLTFNVDYQEAHAIQNNARRLLAQSIPTEEAFESEPMILYQVRDAKGASGDMGIIDRFGRRAMKLTWANDAVKSQILDAPENPFACVFFVSGRCKTADGKVVAYHIHSLNGSMPKD